MGLAPTSPVIREAKTSVTPVFVRTAKRPAVRRFTAGWALGRALTVAGVDRWAPGVDRKMVEGEVSAGALFESGTIGRPVGTTTGRVVGTAGADAVGTAG
jgi:hypothetical protein